MAPPADSAHCIPKCMQGGLSEKECQQRCKKIYGDDGSFLKLAVDDARKDLLVAREKAQLLKDIKVVNSTRWSEAQKAGRAAEDYHRATFNVDAIQKDIKTRAVDTPYRSPADLKVGGQGAQLKYGSAEYIKSIDQPKYDGMQKIVPKGHADMDKGWCDRITKNGAQSKALSNEDAKKLVRDPRAFAGKAIPTQTVGESALKAGFGAALAGGAIGGVISGAATALGGADAGTVFGTAAEGAFQGAVSSGLSTAATDVIVHSGGDVVLGAFGGGIVSGAVSTVFNVRRCSKRFEKDEAKKEDCQVKEVVKGTTSTTAAVTSTLICSTFMGPFGVVCGMVAGAGARAVFDEILK